MEKIAVFPGSFDPFTNGHLDILNRGLQLFDQIILGIGINSEKSSHTHFEQKIKALRLFFSNESRISVESYTSLTTDFALHHKAQFILRGVRNYKDYEYERDMAIINRELTGIETVILLSDPTWSFISSSIVRELLRYGQDVSPYIPKGLCYE